MTVPEVSDFYKKNISINVNIRILSFTAVCISKSGQRQAFNIVLNSEIGGGHIYLLSHGLVTLHSAEALGQKVFQMCSSVLSSH